MLSQYMEEKTFKMHAGVHAYQGGGGESIESMQVTGLLAHCFGFRDCFLQFSFLVSALFMLAPGK